jgi:hypothetical protein
MSACLRLIPGAPQLLYLEPGVTWRAKANTATCKVLFWALNS